MGIPQVDTFNKVGLCVPKSVSKKSDTDPPEIPPRMKKTGPELPEKPPHLRLASLTTKASKFNGISPSRQPSSQQYPTGQFNNETNRHKISETHSVPFKDKPSNDQKLFMDIMRKKTSSTNREVLVAATKGPRERPAEKRQREPAKLLMPINKSSVDKDNCDNESLPVLLGLSSPKPRRKSNYPDTAVSKVESYKALGNHSQKLGKSRAPVILIPRSQLDTRSLHHIWNSYPISYSLWVQNSGSGDPQMASRLLRRSLSPNSLIIRHGYPENNGKCSLVKSREFPIKTSVIVNGKKSSSGTSVKPRSSSVSRSGSLTSHGSTSSESGNETFPKSVLKKHKSDSCSSSSESSKKTQEHHKKNVTFNAFATVQLMEE